MAASGHSRSPERKLNDTQESWNSSLSSISKRKEKRLLRQPTQTGGALKAIREEPVVTDLPRLQQALKKDFKVHARAFWDALKKGVDHKFGETEVAFEVYSCSIDHVMSCEQFGELCESVGLSLDARIIKQLFDTALKKETDVAITYKDFQDAWMGHKLDKLRARFNSHHASEKRIQGCIDQFMKRLSIESGDDSRRHAVNRLQKKMDLPFCVELHAGLQRYVMRIGTLECAVHLEDLMMVIDNCGRFHAYELTLIRNMYDRVDRSRCGSVHITDVVVAFTLLASECAVPQDMRKEKLRFLFTVFDTDGDGCLTGEEILRMYCSIAIHSAIASGDQPSYDADMALGDELSLSKARRLYDFTTMHLQQSEIHDLCTFQELWTTFEAFPGVMEPLIPTMHGNAIMWVLRPLRPVRQEELPAKRSGTKQKLDTTIKPPMKRATLAVEDRKSKWSTVSASLASSSHNPGASRMPLKRPASRSKSVEVSKTERFRVQAAIRFRHALRGEWDVVSTLQSAPSQSQEGWYSENTVKLPSLVHSGSSADYGSTGKLDKSQQVSWSEATTKFDRRQKEGHWQNSHRQSITNWAHEGLGSQDESPPRLRTTRSMPIMRRPSGPSRMCAMSAEEVKAHAEATFAEITSSEAKVLESTQAVIAPQHWGKEAMVRVKHVAKARVSVIASGGAGNKTSEMHSLTDDMAYDCQLCHGRHKLSVPCFV